MINPHILLQLCVRAAKAEQRIAVLFLGVLDVYKRQMQPEARPPRTTRHQLAFNPPASRRQRDPKQPAANPPPSPTPVSYTHLDVYKRQAVVVSQPAAASVQPTARPMAKRRRIRKSLRLSSESRKGPLPITPGQNDPVSSIMRRCRTGTPARFRIRYLFAIARPAGGTKGRQAGSAVPCEDDIACS